MSSPIWLFFSVAEDDNTVAICSTCSARVARGGKKTASFNTTNLISHLRGRHRNEAVFGDFEAAAASTEAKTKRRCADVCTQQEFKNCLKVSEDSEKTKAINDKVMEFIALDDQPLSVVEDRGFRQLITHLEPRYTLPSRRYFSDVSLPALYDAVAAHIRDLIDKSAANVSLTAYIWASAVSPVSMLSFTARWLDEDFKVEKALLHAQETSGSLTARAIGQAFEATCEKWNITKDRVHVVLGDNARNVTKAMGERGVASLSCMAHTLQLAVTEALLSQRSIADCVSICRTVAGHFEHSPLAASRLEEAQTQLGMGTTRLRRDVCTRWTSTFYMLRSLLEQRRALAAYGVDFELPASLNVYQWTLIENVLIVLDPCEQVTQDISSATATAADVIPSIEALKRLLNKIVATDQGVQSTLLQAIEERFSHICTEPLYYLATILDPRYKNCYFNQATKRRAEEMLRHIVNCATAKGADEPLVKKIKVEDNNNVSLLTMYEEILEENYGATKELTQTEVQIRGYLSESPIPRTGSTMEYWRSNKFRFPDLAAVARKYLSAPCTSIDSERLFSAAVNVIDEKRNRIGCEKAEMLLFIKKNLPMMPSHST